MYKHLIDLNDFTRSEWEEIIHTAVEIEKNPQKYSHACEGKILATLFYEPSTRTRMSFQTAMLRLGGNVIGFDNPDTSSVSKGESVKDTAKIVSGYADIIAMRSAQEGAAYAASMFTDCPVINAGDGTHAHPTQALLDLFTILERKGQIKGLTVTILGDILHSRVARSNIWGLTKLGAHVRVCGPPTLMPTEVEQMGAKVYYDIDEALEGADVVNVLRIQLERQQKGLFPSIEEYAKCYAMTEERLKRAKSDLLVLHPGPMNRTIEIPTAVADSAQCTVEEQVTNGVACRMALLYLMSGGGQDE